MSHITVFHTSPYAAKKEAVPIQRQDEVFIAFEELKNWVKSGKIFFHLFRYSKSHIQTYDAGLVAKPFLLFLLIRMLSRGSSYYQDRKGVNRKITIKLLLSLFLKMSSDFLKKNRFVKNIKLEVSRLYIDCSIKKRLDLSRQPIYLRTDLCFGLRSGGSVGHIAGVLNHLHHFTGEPIFLTSDLIPTVKSEWESHIVSPGNDFWDFSELPALHYNKMFFPQAIQKIGDRLPAFVYQRYSLNNFSGIQLANYYQIPFVLEFNGSEIWISRNWGDRLKYETFSEQVEKTNLDIADLIVVVSDAMKNDLKSRGISEQKILVNPNGVDPDRYSPNIDSSRIRKQYQLEDKTVLGFIGTFGKWHGAEVLAEAYGILLNKYPEMRNEIKLLFIGDGMTLPQTRKKIEEAGVSDCCIFTGTVAQEDGPSYLAACDILVSPHIPNKDGSPFFGSPTKLFEYMAMGKAIIASDLDQIGQILKHDHTAFLVKPNACQDLSVGLKTLMSNPTMRRRLGAAARKQAVELHTWKAHTQKIIESLMHARM